MKHYIEINEQHRKIFAVEADSEEDAISRVEAAYDTGTIMVTDSETVFLSYNAVRNRQELERLLNSGSYSVLPDRPTTYTAEYTLTINVSETESRDICCKSYDYQSIDEAKDDSPSVIAGMLYEYKIPDGTYTLDAGYYSAVGEEEPVYVEGILIKVLYQDGRILLEEKMFKKGKVKKMKKWKIPVTWEVCGVIECEAPTLEEAMEYAEDKDGVIPLPDESDYVDGSWRLSYEMDEAETVRECWNEGQTDEKTEDAK